MNKERFFPRFFIDLFDCVLPAGTLFIYLFYLLWAFPLSMVLQEFTIHSLYLKANSYVHLALIICSIFFIFLFLTKRYCHILNHFVIGLLIFGLLSTYLYNIILPYNFGGFLDNDQLTPAKSLLKFSKWYYLLDLIILGLSLVGSYFLIKSKYYKVVLSFFFLFYLSQDIAIFYRAIKNKEVYKNSFQNGIVKLSKNQQNILFFIFDGMGPAVTHYVLSDKNTDASLLTWSKDFTFYDNTTSLSSFNTAGSVGSIYESYKRPPQYIFSEALKEKKTYQFFILDPHTNFVRDLSPYVDFDSSLVFFNKHMPILIPKIYTSMPYFLRYLVTSGHAWLYHNYSLWVLDIDLNDMAAPNFQIFETKKPIIYHRFSDRTHPPWVSKQYPKSLYSDNIDAEIAEKIIVATIKEVFEFLSETVESLKKHGVYDNSTIIVMSDHDTHCTCPGVDEFLEKVSKNNEGVPRALPSLLMIKERNAQYSKMLMNNNFITLADVRPFIEDLLGIAVETNFIKNPKKRSVNILMPYRAFKEWIVGISGSHWEDVIKLAPQRSEFRKFTNMNPYKEVGFFSVPTSEVAGVPSYTLLE